MEFGRMGGEHADEQESELEVFSLPSVRENILWLHGA